MGFNNEMSYLFPMTKKRIDIYFFLFYYEPQNFPQEKYPVQWTQKFVAGWLHNVREAFSQHVQEFLLWGT